MWFGQKLYHRDGKTTHGVWKPYDTHEAAASAGCDLISILELCVSTAEYEAWDAANPKGRLEVPFRGPFYADFDDKDDLETLKDRLVEPLWDLVDYFSLDERDLRLWFSGSKGFHLTLDAAIFSPPGFSHPLLPVIYRRFASKLSQDLGELMDEAVYSRGKGRLWRVAHRKRPNGYRKIPLTLLEMTNLSVRQIREMAKQAKRRFDPPQGRALPNRELFAIFAEVRRQVEAEQVERKQPSLEQAQPPAPVYPWDPDIETALPQEFSEKEVLELLAQMPDNVVHEYSPWVRVGMALHTVSRGAEWGLRLWDNWSQQSGKYEAGVTQQKWRSFKPGLVGMGTLRHLVRGGEDWD